MAAETQAMANALCMEILEAREKYDDTRLPRT